MRFLFAKSKSDQEGDQIGPLYLYANLLQPRICPVLALAQHAFSYPDILTNGSKFLPGSKQYKWCMEEFHNATKKHDE